MLLIAGCALAPATKTTNYPDELTEWSFGTRKTGPGELSQLDDVDFLRRHTSRSRAQGISESASRLRPPLTACLFVGGARSSWVADRFLSSILPENARWDDVDGEASGISNREIGVAHICQCRRGKRRWAFGCRRDLLIGSVEFAGTQMATVRELDEMYYSSWCWWNLLMGHGMEVDAKMELGLALSLAFPFEFCKARHKAAKAEFECTCHQDWLVCRNYRLHVCAINLFWLTTFTGNLSILPFYHHHRYRIRALKLPKGMRQLILYNKSCHLQPCR